MRTCPRGGFRRAEFESELENDQFLHPESKKRSRKREEGGEKTLAIALYCPIRSNFNSRGVNSRELRRVFGHSSESSGWILTKIGGNCSYRPPGAF